MAMVSFIGETDFKVFTGLYPNGPFMGEIDRWFSAILNIFYHCDMRFFDIRLLCYLTI